MDELEIDLDQIEAQEEKKIQVKDRFAKLSSDYTQTRKDKEAAEAKAQAEADARIKAEKERDFYKGFSQVSSKFPEATNFQDQILERTAKGMDAEEATIAVLYKEGKLGTSQPIGNVAGGSSPNTPSVEKDFSDMNLDEKKEVMMGLEKSGDLERLLRR